MKQTGLLTECSLPIMKIKYKCQWVIKWNTSLDNPLTFVFDFHDR